MELWLAGLLAAVFGLVAGVDYIFRIFGRTIFGWRKTAPTHPRAATWLVWAVMGLILASAYSSSGARETAWSAWAMAVEFVVVAVLAIIYDSRTRRLKPVGLWSYAIKDIDATEWKCMGGAAVAGILWLASGEPLLALFGSYAVDLFAALPTLRQAFRRPLEEPTSAWLLTVVGNGFNLLAVPEWRLASLDSFAIWSYPVYMLAINGLILIFLMRHIRLSKASS